MFVQTLAQEMAAGKVRVNAVAARAIRTPINKKAWDTDAALRTLLELVPYSRIGEREDVAAVSWLASDKADYVTRTTVLVDGGMTLLPRHRR